jgi:chromosome segregation protein
MLKSLEIFGFKSFADRIRFDFASGITGVVGPNGSGKSNVVDSIKWILGDQSAKSLRGKEMTDVIFNGASNRKPSAFAEATLTFDNSSGFLPIAAREVQIGRRIYRSGEAEYLINRTTSRLKDIRDLFMGTGAGSASYCIIEQGRVEQILQANVSARRLVFEEAAGISRFKTRKVDAERKLERVDQNVARLTDIVDEVEAQLNTIRSQAVKAAKYRQVSEQLRELWLGLAADQHREHSSKLATIEQALAEEQSLLDGFNARLSEIETALAGVDAGISDVDDNLREVERQRAAHREEAAGHEATARHQTARLREMDADLVRLRRQRALINSRRRDAERNIAAALEQCARLGLELASRKEALAGRERQCDALIAAVDARRRELEAQRQLELETIREITQATHRVTVLNSQADQQRAAILVDDERQRALDERLPRCHEECALHRERQRTAAEHVARLDESLNTIQQERLTMSGVHDQFHKTLAERREQRSAGRARKSVLEDLESRQEGLGIGVKDILSRARTARTPPWNEVLGSVAELLEVDLEQAALAEIALGRRAQAIVIDDLEPLIDYLNQASVPIAGRVGFVVRRGGSALKKRDRQAGGPIGRFLESLELDPAAVPDLSTHAGVQCRADSMVRCSPQAPALAEQLLCDTWVVDTLETAFELAADAGRGCRFVTLQGELVDSDGTLTVGALRGETTPVSQKSELRRLKNDLARLDRQIRDDEQRLEALLASLNETDGVLEAAKGRFQEAAEHHAQCKIDSAERERELARLVAERQVADRDSQDNRRRLRETLERLEQAQLESAALEGATQTAREQAAALESELVAAEERRIAAGRLLNAEQLELAKQEERLQSLRESHDRLEQDQQQFGQQVEEAARRLQHVLADRQRVSLHILNTNSRLAESFLQTESLAHQVSEISAQKGAFRARRGELLREETARREERRRTSDRLHTLDLQARELRQQMESLSGRIEEEYQVRLTEVVASGASAFQIYLAELSDTVGENRGRVLEPAFDEVADDSAAKTSERSGAAPVSRDSIHDVRFEDVRDELEARVNRLRRQLKLMGSVNTESLRDLDELERRFAHLSEQLADLVEAKRTLEEILRRINTESKRLFTESFQLIRGHFQELFRKFFGGGEGDVVLEDSQDVLECGIEIVARPPGKELRSISLLSGGEKTLTAIALLLAIFKSRPSPFCILDEVDAALDEANVERFAAVLREFKQMTQFIMITHSKRSMASADILYGVTMEESGVSKRLSVRFDDVDEKGEIRGASAEQKTARRGAA